MHVYLHSRYLAFTAVSGIGPGLGRLYMAHRLAWLYVYGEHPSDQIDHINGEKADNRIANLRVVNQRQNSENQRKPKKSNKAGALGVAPQKGTCRFIAQIVIKGTLHRIGSFLTVAEASAAYVEWKRRYHEACTI